ncbi:nucleotide sugar dehydrogenase [Yinghuangia seranimata]|uniref:nucleotide sugar dehydrogenase n=1 Tax=Yinghuangia seranimata TaxID=408067 RepID=UPI00248C6D25|nr:nucleotide sugar dehydrogenase [Yinghuangia seranimata]MDI2132255.1 nucleotide sugar dehydrogenase [Yinghuangia seranimata]
MKICVVALGKIGLPLAVQFAGKGHDVVGADVNAATVDLVGKGVEPFPGEAELETRLRGVIDSGALTATVDTTAAVAASDYVVVVVPVVVDAEARPDFRAMDAATEAIAAGLRPGTLVSYETTLPVHTTRSRFLPRLEAASGLVCGTDFFLCHSPERVLTGRVFADLRRYPKLVGGVDEESAKRAVAFYEAVLDFDPRPDLARGNGVWDMGSAEAAELAKLAETTYRDVNIGLANQFARFADSTGIDIAAVIEAANSQPYSHIHRPGIAVGGHCIPVYPRFYAFNDPDATIVKAARTTNAGMPGYAVGLLDGLLSRDGGAGLAGARVAVLGMAYRGGVKETAFSGVFPVVEALRAAGAEALVSDPLYGDHEVTALGLTPYHQGDPVDAVIVQTDHAEYRTISAREFPGVRAIVDGRRVTDPERWAGVAWRTIGGGR